MEEKLLELFQKGYVKGTVTIGIGNEVTAVGMTMPLRPGRDAVSLLHRDFAGHVVLGSSAYELFCQYMANADSPTHGCEGNVHHGDAASRRFPMLSHLGKMLSVVVGGTWAARRHGEDVFGLAAIGDGGQHRRVPRIREPCFRARGAGCLPGRKQSICLFHAHATAIPLPTNFRSCSGVRHSAAGRSRRRLWSVYSSVRDALEAMQGEPAAMILECMSMRLHGHAAYDKGRYVSGRNDEAAARTIPCLPRGKSCSTWPGMSEAAVTSLETAVDEEIQAALAKAMTVARPEPGAAVAAVYASAPLGERETLPGPAGEKWRGRRPGVGLSLGKQPACVFGGYGRGRIRFGVQDLQRADRTLGPQRVIDMPLSESAIMGLALGASQLGERPIIEFQFADFSTEAVTQLGLNAGTWHFRAGRPARCSCVCRAAAD